jgi:multimeric flavodoxin WrbA
MSENNSSSPDILFISGSPRAHTCEGLVSIIEAGARQTGARSQRFFLSQKRIVPCTGCNACTKTGICVLASKTAGDKLIDDYLELKVALERVDALALVVPLFFAGPPAQLKALYDRLQPYWAQKYILGGTPPAKRPAQLFIVGGGDAYGHDPHGHEPLVGITKSALAVAGFSLEKVHNFVGFRYGKDKPMLPSETASENKAFGELAQLKRAVAAQEDFEQRARDAGGALARFAVWAKTPKDAATGAAATSAAAAATADADANADAAAADTAAAAANATAAGTPPRHSEIAVGNAQNLELQASRSDAELSLRSPQHDIGRVPNSNNAAAAATAAADATANADNSEQPDS